MFGGESGVPISLAGIAAAQQFLDRIGTGPGCHLVRGDAGGGKSLLLAAVRERLHADGTRIHSTVASAERGDGALVLDGAHSLPGDEITALTALARRNDLTLVVATEPRPHDAELRALTATMESLGPAFDLRALTIDDIDARARDRGITLVPGLLELLHQLTGGVLAAVDAGLAATAVTADMTGAGIRAAVATHLHDRLRHLDGELLSALAVCMCCSSLDTTDLAAALSIPTSHAHRVADRARASAVVTRSDVLLDAARPALTAVVGVGRLRELQQRLLSARLDGGALDLPTARTLAAAGLDDPRLAVFLSARADSAEPAKAVELYESALQAGADPDVLALRRCEASALCGDLDAAERLADSLLSRADSLDAAELAAAVRISSSIAACRGEIGRSADLYEWLGPGRVGADAPVAATVLLAAGRPEAAAGVLTGERSGPPTSGAAGVTLLADGLAQSIAGTGAVAMNSLTRALALLSTSTRSRMLPDTATAVTALLCLHSGELAHAESILAKALTGAASTSTARTRHLVLSAWTAMTGGELANAAAILESLPADQPVHPREALFVHGLRVGLARRHGDIGTLHREWADAQPVVAGYSVDLFCLLPLGELWLAAVRIGDEARIAHLVDDALELVRRLGEPALWGASLHWYGVQAAILGENPTQLLPHARALAASAAVSSYAAGLAAAGRVWLRVLRGEAEPAEVESAARTLERIGLPWDGARLASEAALRVSDTSGATTLLQVARSLRGAPSTPSTQPASGTDPATEPTGGSLTDREAEVAELLVLGLTHREIGARLYIAPKTVEHHVARIRRRLGASSRSELMSMLRAIGHGNSESFASRAEGSR
ncbi:LuxR family transcriptional regulator [Rhodococcus sp. ABRD24]|nr:LuxR family transcriptional regulator [Rhodococcus sp. ABRD24]